MINRRVMILAGSNGQSFFFREALLAEGLAGQVDLVYRVDQAIGIIIHRSSFYDMVVINLVEAWVQGLELSSWLRRKSVSCPVILISPSESAQSLVASTPFTVLPAPVSLCDFTKSVRAALQSVSIV